MSSVSSADRCSMADAVTHMGPSQRTDPDVLEIGFTSPSVFDAYLVDLNSKGDWNLSYIKPSSELEVCLNLWVDSLLFAIGASSTPLKH